MKQIKSILITAALIAVLFSCANPALDVTNEPVQEESSQPVKLNQEIEQGQYSKSGFTANVMAPLHVTNWGEFENQLRIAKSIGVDAVSVDVWWGDVEGSGDQQFNWSYYDTIFGKIRNADLDIVAIMSFHQCGGNVGDDYTSYVPSWIWNHYTSNGISATDMQYKSETGAYSGEYVALWADQYVIDEYVEFMDAFENRYGHMASDFDEINVSGGTAGELRYPSYNSHDWGGYPNRGTFQFYGRLAVEDFRNSMKDKYNNSISSLNRAWGTSLGNFNQINVPSDPGSFVANKDYQYTAYGKDLIFWYNNSLKLHGKRLIAAAAQAFDSSFSGIDIGVKMAGVHWKMGDPSNPRIAEITAGLIETTGNFNSSSTGYGYKNILSTCKDNGRNVVFHFTCLEMSNQNWSPAYSKAQDLVFWVANEAAAQGISIKGENALSGGVESDSGWNNVDNAFQWASYTGMTVLRIGNVTYNNTGKTRYGQFIDKYGDDNFGGKDLVIHYKEFESASNYKAHCWEGLTGQHTLSYEGYFNGGHWWKVTISNAPANFKFCFVNSNGSWDGTNRSYSGQANEIYIQPGDATVYTSRP